MYRSFVRVGPSDTLCTGVCQGMGLGMRGGIDFKNTFSPVLPMLWYLNISYFTV